MNTPQHEPIEIKPDAAPWIKRLARFLNSAVFPVKVYPRGDSEEDKASFDSPEEAFSEYDWQLGGKYKIEDSTKGKARSISLTIPLDEEAQKEAAKEWTPERSLTHAVKTLTEQIEKVVKSSVSLIDANGKILHEVAKMHKGYGQRIDTQNAIIAMMAEGNKPSVLSDPGFQMMVGQFGPALLGLDKGGWEKKAVQVAEALRDPEKREAITRIGSIIADAFVDVAYGAYERKVQREDDKGKK